MKNLSQLFRTNTPKRIPKREQDALVAKIKAQASNHREVVNNALSVLRTTDCVKEKRTNLQIVKERLSSIHQITKTHSFITVSVDALAKVEQEIHRIETELQMQKSGIGNSNPSELIQQIKFLKSQEKYNDAAKLLMHCISTSEEASAPGMGVSPWYYEQLAEIFRSQKEYAKEVTILERYLRRDKSPGQSRGKLFKRLDEARRLKDTFGSRGV